MAGVEITDTNKALSRTAMVAGEVLVPGASELIAGNIGSGVGHFIATGLAVAVLAPTMPLLATLAAIGLRVNSYSKATTGTNVVTTMSSLMPTEVTKPKSQTGTASA